MTFPNTLVKMHGDYAKDNIVLTESDYFNYKENFPLICCSINICVQNRPLWLA